MLARYRPFIVCLATLLAICFAAKFASEAQAEHSRAQERESAPRESSIRHQEFERFRQFAKRHGVEDMSEEGIGEIVELVRAWRMIKEVGLAEEESLRFLDLRREMREKTAEIAEQREPVQDTLEELVGDSEATDDEIAKRLKALEEIEERDTALRRQYEKRMVEGLSVRQRAKLKLFTSHFDRDVRRRLIQRIRERREGRSQGRRRGSEGRPERRR